MPFVPASIIDPEKVRQKKARSSELKMAEEKDRSNENPEKLLEDSFE